MNRTILPAIVAFLVVSCGRAFDPGTNGNEEIVVFAFPSFKAPDLVTPPSGRIIPRSGPVRLGWRPVELAHSFEVQTALDSLFTRIYATGVSDTIFVLWEFDANRVYYWRVRGYHPDLGHGAWSETRSFRRLEPN